MMDDENDESKEKKVYERKKSFKEAKEAKNLGKRSVNLTVDVGSDNFSGLSRDGFGGFQKEESLLRVSLATRSKQEAKELRRKLEEERDVVRSLIRRIEANEAGVGPPRMSKPLNQLSVPVHENSKSRGEKVEKEKRTPKANKMYRNSDFLLAKDKFPAGESNKKSKSAGKKGGGVEVGKLSTTQVFKNCGMLLERLMKHKHGWVFNTPVDVVALGLHDYFEVIKNPMDLGTVKNRLAQNWYNTPLEFAEDVRLTFRNAMTYNGKGQDVYVMAELLSKLFEEKWLRIEADYARELKGAIDVGSPAPAPAPTPMPTSRKVAPKSKTRPEMKKVLERSESVTPVAPKPKQKAAIVPQPGRVLVTKKPKAKDPNKREMTYDEKQKLSMDLQNLPSEKLENVVRIIRKRNPSLTQQDDEIEVDIDSVDTETLWELDRFITNFKKSLNKNKRKAESVNDLIVDPEQATQEKENVTQEMEHITQEMEHITQEMIPTPVVTEPPKESKINEVRVVSPPVHVEEPGDNATNQADAVEEPGDNTTNQADAVEEPGDNTTNQADAVEEPGDNATNQGDAQSSSGADSGSSSSGDSEGESSSGDGSDGGDSPKD